MSQDAEDPPSPADPFDVLALPPRFGLDGATIERAYLARAAAIHPDLADPDAEVQADAARRSAALNTARAALLDPERRAIALLARMGGPSASESRELPDGFLMDMMQTRERIEEELAENPDEARPRWRGWASDQRDRHAAEVASLFESAEHDAEVLAEIRRRLNAWRYIERLAEQLELDDAPGGGG